MKVVAVYKCALCGDTKTRGNPTDLSEDEMLNICWESKLNPEKQILENKFGMPGIWLGHRCKDGNFGMTYFAGFLREE